VFYSSLKQKPSCNSIVCISIEPNAFPLIKFIKKRMLSHTY